MDNNVAESIALLPGLIEGIILSPQSNPDLGTYNCSRCRTPMRLVCIEPGKPGFDLRTFECARCSAGETFLVPVAAQALRGAVRIELSLSSAKHDEQ
jgi:hypothetical protein